MALRLYQISFREAIKESLRINKRIIACSATGSGKTEVFMDITQSAIDKGRTVLILTEDRRIFEQTANRRNFHLIKAGTDSFHLRVGHAYLAMAQTLAKRPQMIRNFAFFNKNLLIIADEAHIGTMTGVIKQLPEAYLIGFTATPDYRIAKHLPDLYNDCVVGPQPDQLVQEGYLTPYRHHVRRSVAVDFSQLVVGSNGEYTESSQEIVFNAEKLYDKLAEDLKKFKYTKGSIYTASIKQAETTCKELRHRGFDATVYHSKSPDLNLKLFTHGRTNLIVSVGSLTKGWDFPPIDLIVLYLKTKSLAKYLQVCGRGSRIWKEGVAGFDASIHAPKDHWTVLDYGGNGDDHKGWDQDRDWAELWKRKGGGGGLPPVKICPNEILPDEFCEYMMAASLMVCPQCGYVFPLPNQDPGETVLVELNAGYKLIVGKKISQLTPQELAEYAKTKNKANYAVRIAKARELKSPGFLRDYAAAMDYKPNWLYYQNRMMDEAMRECRPGDDPFAYNDFILK